MLSERGLIVDVVQTTCDQDSQGFPDGLGSMEYDRKLKTNLVCLMLILTVDGRKQFLSMVSHAL